MYKDLILEMFDDFDWLGVSEIDGQDRDVLVNISYKFHNNCNFDDADFCLLCDLHEEYFG